MKSSFVRRFGVAQGSRCAFTLIELLAVMAIIVLLAALVLGIANHANTKASMSRATTEVRSFEAALENYKIDNGTVPRATVTDILNPQVDFDPSATNARYKNSSNFLYQALSGFQPDGNGGVGTRSPSKIYFKFQPSQIEIFSQAGSDKVKDPNSPYMYIVDPFGFSYGYSTAYANQKEIADNGPTAGATPAPGYGYNPTFDLWSTAGYARTGGKSIPSTSTGSPAAVYSNLWIKNW